MHATDQGLLAVLKFIESDGKITTEEFRSLATWLLANPASAATSAGKVLLERMVKQFADGVISPEELMQLKEIISSCMTGENSAGAEAGSTFADEWLPAVGESHYRDAFVALLGPSKEEGEDQQRIANLICEPNNPYDHNAVAVWIEGHRVGFLSRDSAVAYHAKYGAVNNRCQAHITAGWDRGGSDRGDYCVRLAFSLRPE
jgi:hypothetical protein